MLKRTYLYLLLISISALYSCDVADSADELDVSFVTYDVDGNNAAGKTSGILLKQEDDEGEFYSLTLTETSDEGNIIQIIFATDDSENLIGTYDINSDNGLLAYLDRDANIVFDSFSCSSVSGSINITEHDTENRTIGGTFSGTLCSSSGNTRTISNGQIFGVRYVVQN